MQVLTRARGQMLLGALLFSTGGAAIKACDLTAWQIAGLRSGIAALVLLVLLRDGRRFWRPRCLLVGVTYAATLVLYVQSNKLTTAANSIFLQSTAPLYVLLLGPWLLRERARLNDVLLTLVVGLGLGLILLSSESVQASAPDPERGNLLATLSGLTWALTLCGLRSLGSDGAATETGTSLGAVVAGNLIACAVCLPVEAPVAVPALRDVLLILFLGAFQIGLAYVLVTAAFRHVSALEGSLLLLLEPVLNPIVAWGLEGEVPGAGALLGGALIVGATALRTWLNSRSAPAAREAEP